MPDTGEVGLAFVAINLLLWLLIVAAYYLI